MSSSLCTNLPWKMRCWFQCWICLCLLWKKKNSSANTHLIPERVRSYMVSAEEYKSNGREWESELIRSLPEHGARCPSQLTPIPSQNYCQRLIERGSLWCRSEVQVLLEGPFASLIIWCLTMACQVPLESQWQSTAVPQQCFILYLQQYLPPQAL